VTGPPAAAPPVAPGPVAPPPVTAPPVAAPPCCAYALKTGALSANKIIEIVINDIFIVLINKASIINGLTLDVIILNQKFLITNIYKCIHLV
jgi:hypothetical protein